MYANRKLERGGDPNCCSLNIATAEVTEANLDRFICDRTDDRIKVPMSRWRRYACSSNSLLTLGYGSATNIGQSSLDYVERSPFHTCGQNLAFLWRGVASDSM